MRKIIGIRKHALMRKSFRIHRWRHLWKSRRRVLPNFSVKEWARRRSALEGASEPEVMCVWQRNKHLSPWFHRRALDRRFLPAPLRWLLPIKIHLPGRNIRWMSLSFPRKTAAWQNYLKSGGKSWRRLGN